MTTYNRIMGNQAVVAKSVASSDYGRKITVLETAIDFSVTGNTNASADIFNVLDIPAGYAILATGLEVLKVDSAGNSGTVTLKIGSTSQGSAVAPTSLGFLATVGTMTPVVPTATTNTVLNVVIGTGAINAIVRVYAVILDVRMKLGTGVVTGTATAPDGTTHAAVAIPSLGTYVFETSSVPVP